MDDHTPLSELDEAAADDLATEISRAFIRSFETFKDSLDVPAAVAYFHAEVERLASEWRDRYQPETGRRIVHRAHQIVLRDARAAFLTIGVDLEARNA